VVEGVTNDLLGFGYGFLGYICFIGMLRLGNKGIGREWVQIDEKQWCDLFCSWLMVDVYQYLLQFWKFTFF